jgi:hypothetical protein
MSKPSIPESNERGRQCAHLFSYRSGDHPTNQRDWRLGKDRDAGEERDKFGLPTGLRFCEHGG